MRNRTQRNLAKPPIVWSLNRSMTTRIQMKMQEMTMKNQKLHRRTSQKLVRVEIHGVPFVRV